MFGKARNKAELQQLKNEYLANLQVEIENSNILEKKIRKPDEAPPVPPQYKTEAELRADIQAIDNELIQTIMNDIGYGYARAVETIGNLSTDDKIKLLALYPQFKSTLAKDGVKSRLRLLDPSFVNQKIKQFIQLTNKSTGASNLAGIPTTIEELQQMMPTEDDIVKTIKTISYPDIRSVIDANTFKNIDSFLRKYLGVYPTLSQVNSFKTSQLNSTTRFILAQDLGKLILDYKMITKDDLDDIRTGIADFIRTGEVEQIGNFVRGKLGGADEKDLKLFASNWKTTLATAGGENLPPLGDIEQVNIDYTPFTEAEIEKEAVKLQRYKDAVDNSTFKERAGRMYQRGYVPVDVETSTIATNMSDDLFDLMNIANTDLGREYGEDLNSLLSERPQFAPRFKEISRRTLNSAGYRDVNEIRDSYEAEELLRLLHDEADSSLKENVGMTITEIEEDEYGNVLREQEELADMEQEDKKQQKPITRELEDMINASMKGRILLGDETSYSTLPSPAPSRRESVSLEPELSSQERGAIISNVFGDIEAQDATQELSRLGVDTLIRQVEERVKKLVSVVRVRDIQPIVDLIFQYASLNYGVDVGLPPVFSSQITTKSQIVGLIMERVVIPVINANFEYNPNDMRLFNPADYEETRSKKGLSGFGMKKMKKGFHKMPDGKIMKDEKMGSGMKGRISVKKLVGRGIAVENQPTYKQFGKYVMHYPHLVNSNVFNVKYPSLGSIPAIKPKTITDEYKDFVLDIFDTGKMNERLFNTLDDDEKTHFHKVCKGAGLLELFKLKKSDTNEEKDDLDRFNLLKGSFVAGNNGESVIRELRGLITKFIHEGRITKNEGLSLLMEIK
jgi:hypothetical protein